MAQWQRICLPMFDPWVRKILWGRKWHPLQYPCLGNPTDREAWQPTDHEVTEELDMTEQLSIRLQGTSLEMRVGCQQDCETWNLQVAQGQRQSQ